MVRATYQRRLSALILGIRPSVGHIYGSTDRVPVDNVTMLGIQAWQAALEQLDAELEAASDLVGGELWIKQWVADELDRELDRWSDASTVLELLALALGPVSADPSQGPRGRMFWTQWCSNIDYLATMIRTGAAATTADTTELLNHCITLVEQHNGPEALVNSLTDASQSTSPVTRAPASFRPLVSAIERLQLSALIAAAYDEKPTCTAAMAKLFEQRPPSPECRADEGHRRRLGGWRYGATVGF